MRFRPLLLLPALCVPLLPATPLDDEMAAQVAAARAILDPWHAEDPEPAVRKLHLVCWVPSDREPAADYQARMTRIMEHIRGFYAGEMERLGFGPRSFNLDYDDKGVLRIHLVKGAGPYADYKVESGSKIRGECLPVLKDAGIDPDRETIVIFCNLATWDPEKLVFTHQSPYYASGNHRQGTAWQLDSPELDSLNLPKTEPMMDDGQYGRISLGKHNSIFIGGIAHELGHALGLPHNRARPDEAAAFGTALMGDGNRSYGDELRKEGKGSFLTLAHALRLASHPQFSGSVKGMNRPADANFTDLAVRADGHSFHFSGKVSGTVPVYAVVAYCDPEDGGDYNATTATAIPDAEGRFSLHCRGLTPGKNAELRLVACHVNGATASGNQPSSRFSYAYAVRPDGTPDLSAIQRRFALAPLVAALNPRNEAAVQNALATIDGTGDESTRTIARRLVAALEPPRDLPPPSAVQNATSLLLTDATPASATVGWGRPAYDHLPGPSLLLEAGNSLFASGIYAHAPARHTYDLASQWSQLSGSCGIAGGHPGSVVFVILADGKELFRSPLLRAGQTADYDVKLDGVKILELRTEDGGDGKDGDWGFWLEPRLTR